MQAPANSIPPTEQQRRSGRWKLLAVLAVCTLVASLFFPGRAALKKQSEALAQPA